MRNKTERLYGLIQGLLSPLIWSLSYLSPKALKGLVKLSTKLLNNRAASRIFYTSDLNISDFEVDHLLLARSIPVKATLDLNDTIQRTFLFYGLPDFAFELLDFCDDATAFFDIGANVGLISCAISNFTPGHNIHVFEPIETTLVKLRANISKNCKNANIHPFALSDKNGKIEIITFSHDSGAASIEKKYRLERIESQNIKTDIRHVEIETKRFDDLFPSISLNGVKKAAFKIDVEGHELSVLQGMENFIKSTALELLFVVEVHAKNFDAVTGWFLGRGFFLQWPDEKNISHFKDNPDIGAIDLAFHRS